MLVFKILTAEQWATLRDAGRFDGAPVDLADGYVHLSAADQVRETAAKHFADQTDLRLVACDAERLGDALAWEPSRGGALFPHLYRALTSADVLWAEPLPLAPDGRHVFPARADLA